VLRCALSCPEVPEFPADEAVTVVTNDGAFRVIALRSTRTARGVVDSQKATGATARLLGDLATGTVLVRITMAPSYRVQGVLRGAGAKGTLVADAYPDGGTRGLCRAPAGEVRLGDGALLQMMRSLPTGQIHQGVVEVSQEHGITGALMNYLLESEQVTSAAAVGHLVGEDGIALAGGWLVQVLPECTDPPLAVMYERLRTDFADVEKVLAELGGDPRKLIAEICWGMDYTETQTYPLDYRCRCSPERVLASLATVGKDDLLEMVQAAEPLFITCDYCSRPFEIPAESLRGLIEAS
jgi:molecular chaperone Hsp33